MSLTKLSLAGNNLNYSQSGDSLVSNIPAGDGKIDILFYSVVKGHRGHEDTEEI
jgi:hypothetical protein